MPSPALTRLSRRWHRWISIAVGLVVFLWAFTGAVMVLPARLPEAHPAIVVPVTDDMLPPAAAVAAATRAPEPVVRSLQLRVIAGRTYYRLDLAGEGVRLVDAITGAPFVLGDSMAARLAVAAMRTPARVASVQAVQAHDLWYRGGPLPVMRVRLGDEGRIVAHVSPDGAVAFTSVWQRFKMVMGNLHSFVVPPFTLTADRVRKLALVATALLTVLLTVSGAVLVFPLRRRKPPAA